MPYPYSPTTAGSLLQPSWNGGNGWAYPQPYQPVQKTVPYSPPVNSLIRVTGIEGAKAYQLPPNSNVILFDGDEAIFYLKSTDGAGFPTIRTFSFQELVSESPEQTPDIYAKKEDMNRLSDKIDRLLEELGVNHGQSDIRRTKPTAEQS